MCEHSGSWASSCFQSQESQRSLRRYRWWAQSLDLLADLWQLTDLLCCLGRYAAVPLDIPRWLNDPRWRCRGIVWHTRQQVGLKTCYMLIIYYIVLCIFIIIHFHSMDWSLRAVLLFSRGGYKTQKNDIHNGITLVKRCRCIHLWRRFGGLQL